MAIIGRAIRHVQSELRPGLTDLGRWLVFAPLSKATGMVLCEMDT